MALLLVHCGVVILLSLVCVQCTNNTISACNGKARNCTEDELCMSTITQTTTADEQKTFTFERDCGDADQCNSTGSMTSLLSTKTRITCCDTDSCTPQKPTLTEGKKLENKIQCPVCVVHGKRKCPSLSLRNCTGDETYCAVYEVKSGTESTTIMGCASESFCHTAQSPKPVNGKITQVMARCVRSGSSVLKPRVLHFLPVLLVALVHIV
ncbi:uncharacterized protein LOC142662642 [Rhinoderma darwinii]|uniref:uncharacterized protein LOC142662642 n=1 Tax=Rhinoderma darwinii TaxID=43563 RepID=UPI003F677240